MEAVHRGFLNWTEERARLLYEEVPSSAFQMVAIITESGHGEKARALALAAAYRAKHPDDWIVAVMPATGTMVEWDLAHFAKLIGILDDYIITQRQPRGPLIATLRKVFDVVYDAAPYAVRAYWAPGHVQEQAEADALVAPFSIFADGFPIENWRMRFDGLSCWDIMAYTTDLAVSPDNLVAPVDCAPWPSEDEMPPYMTVDGLKAKAARDNWERAKLTGVGKYVVIHNGAGPGCRTKVPPIATFEAVVEHLDRLGVRCVQVGVKDENYEEPLVKGCIDRRHFRLPLTNRLINGAECLVSAEGFLPYMARGLGKKAVVLFGPTPYETFAMPFHKNLEGLVERTDMFGQQSLGRACPMGTCFWGGGWAPAEKWATRCPLGMHHPDFNAEHPRAALRCLNFMEPQQVAAEVGKVVLHE